ncbi:MAG: nuclear transport factor 2 family protein, partial [Hyphomonas sp.]|nr:nuclear transport factor 2 family protein [Hyphomonas sp.]
MAQTGPGLKRLVQYAPGWQVSGTPKRDLQDVLDEIIRRYIASYNDRDIDGMLACVTDDVVFENISNAGQSMRLDGKAMMRQVAEVSGNAFSYRRQRLTNLVTGEGKAAAEIEFEGRAAVDLPNGVRAGETVKVRGASFFEFRGPLLCRIADYS